MAFFQCSFQSRVLDNTTSMNVILPQREDHADRRPYRVLFLLHGLSGDHSNWMRLTSVERYADARGIAVVMPSGARSFYLDTACGERYGTYLLEELPAAARAFFPLSEHREDTFIAGLSMGGYGALRCALARPDLFAAAGSFSGALDMAAVARMDPDPRRLVEWRRIFGDLERLSGSACDLFALAERLPASDRARLRLYQCCGTEDVLYPANTRFRDHARRLGFDLTYEEGPGTHEWGYWDRAIERFLGWIGGPA